ncbi:MAG: hypothetical protein ACLGG9_01375 [Thermoleophilia bacterium]
MTVTADSIRRFREGLHAASRGYPDQVADVQARYVDYREDVARQKVAEHLSEFQAAVEADARTAWRAAQAAVEAQRLRVTEARREAEARVDVARVDRLRADLAARIALAPTPSTVDAGGAVSGPFGADPRLTLVGELLDQAVESGDVEMAEALRISAAPVVADAAATKGEHQMTARALARRLRDAGDLARGGVPEVRELRAMEAEADMLRAEILATEKAVTGNGGGAFALSPWSREILGDSWEARGGGVVWKSGAPAESVSAGGVTAAA